MGEIYRTVEKVASAEFTERRSRFIGQVAPAPHEEDALGFLRDVRTANREANHNVYAWSLREGQMQRHSDDGEPQGTAGMPVLDVLLKSDVTDAVLVVTRYFGGVLLGAGGLVRAYSRAASLALEQAGIIIMKLCFRAEVRCGYARYSQIGALIPGYGGAVDRQDFSDLIRIEFHMECDAFPAFQSSLTDASRGECHADILEKKYYHLS